MCGNQFFLEPSDAIFWSLELNRLAVSDPGGFWNTTLPYFRGLLILNSLRSKHKAAADQLADPVVYPAARSSAISRRSRCGSVRAWPVPSSHFCPGAAPQVGQRTASAGFFLVFMVHS